MDYQIHKEKDYSNSHFVQSQHIRYLLSLYSRKHAFTTQSSQFQYNKAFNTQQPTNSKPHDDITETTFSARKETHGACLNCQNQFIILNNNM